MRVGVRLPDQLHAACADSLTESLREQLSALLAEFSLNRALEVTAQTADRSGTAASVTIDQRPVAYLRTEQLRPEHAVEQLLTALCPGSWDDFRCWPGRASPRGARRRTS